ncbi:MAG: hypothetical protein KAW92_04745 [Candidatus Cloacimonetes bacterium]|nr:hypothetical protein [Candidatus Cloacimonadota bacterium]
MKKQKQLFETNKLRYSKLENNRYTIGFTPEVFTTNFERILKECYRRSKHQACNSIVFDLSKVKFFDIFELGLLVLWLLDLRKQEKELVVKFPSQETEVYKFLEGYGFEKFLKNHQIPYIKEEKEDRERDLDFEKGHFLPLTFAHEKIFQEYIETLPDLEVLKDADVVADGAFKNIIIKELRDNIKKHTKDSSPYIIMTKFVMKESEKAKVRFRTWISNRASYGVEWERPFFLNLLQLSDPSFFELVIGDGGPGIPKLLGKIDECKDKKEFDVVDYAFEYDSTSRPEERLLPVKMWLKEEIKDYKDIPPATGLYWVKQIMKRYSGFLSVRSGKTILCYDFLRYPGKGRPQDKLITNWTWKLDRKNKDLKNLCSLPGTHYKIYFPIKKRPWPKRKTYLEIPFYKQLFFKSKAIFLIKYFREYNSLDRQFKSLKEILHKLGEKIRYLKEEISSVGMGLIMVDFTDIDKDNLLFKVLHYLIWEMMRRQNSTLLIAGVNVNEIILSEIYVVGQKVKELGGIKERTLIILDEHLNLEFVGVSEEQRKFLEKLRKSPIYNNEVSKDEERVVPEIDHLFRILDEKYYFIYPRKYIVNKLIETLKNKIKDYILDEENNIFHPDEHVKVHNRYYVEGFFELYKLIENKYWKNKLQKWIEWELRLSNPSVIITIGINSKNLLKYLKNGDLKNIEWLHIDKPLDSMWFPPAKLFMLDKGKKICIITELIGTGKSLNKVLGFLKDYEILRIFTIVDARREASDIKESKFEYKAKSYELKSAVRHPLNFYEDTKPGLWSYETIESVEPSTNALLIKPIVPPEKAIWNGMDTEEYEKDDDLVQDFKNPFLEEKVASTDCVISGHFTTKSNKHMTYFFLVESIAEHYVKEIAETIIKDIQLIKERFTGLKISHLLYPDYNPGTRLIVNYISRSLHDVILRGINADEIFNILAERKDWKGDLGKIEAAIIFDDSFSTGFTIKRLIDIAYEAGAPKFIFAYVLMDRADPFTSRFLSTLSGYGIIEDKSEIRIKHLVDVQIPLFDASNCPICKYIEKLKLLKEEMEKLKLEENKLLKQFLDEEINKKQPKHIESLRDPQIFTSYFSSTQKERIEKCIIRWKLEIAKLHIGARNELKRKTEEYIKHSDDVLILLNAIYEEIMYFFEIQKDVFEQVFYATFKNKLKEACKFFSANSKILSENLGAIISVWYFIDTQNFFENLNEILVTTFTKDTDLLWKSILYVLIFETITGDSHINILIDILITFSNTSQIIENTNVSYELRKIIQYLQRKSEKLTLPSLYKHYVEAILGPYYFDKKYEDICNCLKDKKQEEAKNLFDESILYIKRNLQGMESLLKSNILTMREEEILREGYTELKQIVEQYENLRRTYRIDAEKLESMVEKFKLNFDNIREAVNSLRCNLPSTVDSVLTESEEVKTIFKVHQIKIEDKNYKAEFAFIREEHMKRILLELLSNLKWAFPEKTGNNKIKILTRMSSSGEFLLFEILDNGMSSKKKYGKGHLLVKDIVEKMYGGKFYPLMEINRMEGNWQEGYRKKFVIYLPRVPKPQEKIK